MWKYASGILGAELCARQRVPLLPEEYYVWRPNVLGVYGPGTQEIWRLVNDGTGFFVYAGQVSFPPGTVRFPWLFNVFPDEHT